MPLGQNREKSRDSTTPDRLASFLADSIYWTNVGDATIRGAPLAAGGTVDTLYGSMPVENGQVGVAIDAAAGRIYWGNFVNIHPGYNGTIRGAPLAGGGTVDTVYGWAQRVYILPQGVAVDPAAGRIYWADVVAIRGAPLAGGGTVDTLYDWAHGVSDPRGVAIDAAAGRIYWTNHDGSVGTLFGGPDDRQIYSGDGDAIRGAPLAGGGTVDTLYDSAHGVSGPVGVAIDPAAGRIYWTNSGDNTIRGAPLAAGGTVDTLYGSAQGVSNPRGVAIDPAPVAPAPMIDAGSNSFTVSNWLNTAAERIYSLVYRRRRPQVGRIYWSNNGDNTIRGAPLAAGGTVDTLYGSAQGVSDPRFLAVLRAPLGTGAPTISSSLIRPEGPFFGGAPSGPLGQRLSCSRGAWAADLPGSFLYRAPQSFAYQWRLGGTDIGGATAAAYGPAAPGSYTCRVTATNRAGSAAQTSAAVTVS